MFVHVEREDGRPASQRVAMVRGPLIDELAVALRPRQQHPAGAPAECLAHRDELRAPPLGRAEVASQCFLEGYVRFALITEAIEEILMKNHRVHGAKFFALESIVQKPGCVAITEFAKLL